MYSKSLGKFLGISKKGDGCVYIWKFAFAMLWIQTFTSWETLQVSSAAAAGPPPPLGGLGRAWPPSEGRRCSLERQEALPSPPPAPSPLASGSPGRAAAGPAQSFPPARDRRTDYPPPLRLECREYSLLAFGFRRGSSLRLLRRANLHSQLKARDTEIASIRWLCGKLRRPSRTSSRGSGDGFVTSRAPLQAPWLNCKLLGSELGLHPWMGNNQVHKKLKGK